MIETPKVNKPRSEPISYWLNSNKLRCSFGPYPSSFIAWNNLTGRNHDTPKYAVLIQTMFRAGWSVTDHPTESNVVDVSK